MENKNIIAIDDDPNILDLFKYIFIEDPKSGEDFEDISFYEGDNFNLCLAQNGKAGYDAVKKGYDQGLYYTTAFIDIRMPEWDGIKTAKEIRKIDDKIYVVLITGYDIDSVDDIQEELKHDVFFIHKPFNEFDLYQMGRNLKNSWNKDIKLRNASFSKKHYTSDLGEFQAEIDKNDTKEDEEETQPTSPSPPNGNHDITHYLPEKYEIIEKIDEGGMATIYKARQTNLNRIVALKVLSPQVGNNTELVQRFQEEAQLAAGLNHKNIITIHDVGSNNGLYYISMEYLEGKDLKEMIKEQGAFSEAKIKEILEPVAKGLDFAHENGLVHRDIKSSNIFIDKNERPVLMDFGIAKARNCTQHLTKDGEILGTPEYMSPEQVAGKECSHLSDIYSLGVVMYEMATGKLPFKSKTMMGTLKKIAESKPVPPHKLNSSLSKNLNQCILNCMEKSPRNRPDKTKYIFNTEPQKSLFKSKQFKYSAGIGTIFLVGLFLLLSNLTNNNNTQVGETTTYSDSIIDSSTQQNNLPPIHKNKIQEMLTDAKLHEENGNWKKAVEAYHTVLKIDSTNKEAGERLDNIYRNKVEQADTLFQQKQYQKFKQLNDKLIEHFPEKKIDNLYMQANKYFTSGRLFSNDDQNALFLYNKILDLQPFDNFARSRVKQIIKKKTDEYFQSERYSEFEKINDKLLKYFPGDNIKFYNNWGDRYYGNGRLITIDKHDAINMYQKTLEKDPDNNYAQKQLELINYDLKKFIDDISNEQKKYKVAQLANNYFPETEKYKQILAEIKVEEKETEETKDTNIVQKSSINTKKQEKEEKKEKQLPVDIQWVKVPVGNFYMGGEKGENDEKPIHRVKIDEFLISKYEVTHAQYIKFLNVKDIPPSGKYKGNKLININKFDSPIAYKDGKFFFKGSELAQNKNTPVIRVTWYGAREFCKWVGGRLPTEAEWEYAATYNLNYQKNNELQNIAWYEENSEGKLQVVGEKKPNPLGLYDITGNVWEWCQDWYSDNYYSESKTKNPKGPKDGSMKVARGGSWAEDEYNLRPSNRESFYPDFNYNDVGFRVSKSISK